MTNEKLTLDLVKETVTEIFESVDERGLPVFGVIEMENEHGKPTKHYKPETAFTTEDYKRAANYQAKMASNHKELAEYYAAEFEKRQLAESKTF